MAAAAFPSVDNLVHELTVSTGSSNLTLTNVNGKQSFNGAFNNGATTSVFYYFISNRDVASEREWGEGHLSAASTLVRDVVLGGSNGTSAVNFSAGTKDVVSDIPKAKQVNLAEIGSLAGFRNRLINGGFRICQRNGATATATADNAYFADRWRFLGEQTETLAALDTNMTAAGILYDGALQFGGTTKKGGFWQIIESINCRDLRGSSVTFSAYLKVSNTRLGDIRMGIVEFTGTADSVSGDPISAWGAGSAGVTLAANYAFLNTPANLNVTTANAQYSVTATVGSSANNLAVFVWNDDASYSANDSLYIANAQLEMADGPKGFERRLYQQELLLARRYYFKHNPSVQYAAYGACFMATTSSAQAYLQYPIEMRANPTITESNTAINNATSVYAVTSLGTIYLGTHGATVVLNVAGVPFVANTAGQWLANSATVSYVAADAEL